MLPCLQCQSVRMLRTTMRESCTGLEAGAGEGPVSCPHTTHCTTPEAAEDRPEVMVLVEYEDLASVATLPSEDIYYDAGDTFALQLYKGQYSLESSPSLTSTCKSSILEYWKFKLLILLFYISIINPSINQQKIFMCNIQRSQIVGGLCINK